MVDALTESHRVLKAEGLLFDLRPAFIPVKIGLLKGEEIIFLGHIEETFANDRAANAAVEAAVAKGLFRIDSRAQLECQRHMDSLTDLQSWLAEFKALVDDLPTQQLLYERVARAYQELDGQATIMGTGPLILNVLKKQ